MILNVLKIDNSGLIKISIPEALKENEVLSRDYLAQELQELYNAELFDFLDAHPEYGTYDSGRDRLIETPLGLVKIKIARLYRKNHRGSKRPETFLASFMVPGRHCLRSDIKVFFENLKAKINEINKILSLHYWSTVPYKSLAYSYELRSWCRKWGDFMKLIFNPDTKSGSCTVVEGRTVKIF